jgi:hypothetical protein
MFTLPYNPVAVVPWIVGGLLSGLIFKSSARSPISGKGAGLAGHGTMVMLPLASSGAGNSAFEGRQGSGVSDKVSDNGSRQRPTQRDVPRH